MRRLVVLCALALVCAGVIGCGGSSPPPPAAPATAAPAAPGAPGASTPASGMPGDSSAAAMPGSPTSGSSTSGSTPASRAAMLAPYLDDQTVAIMRLDVAGLNADQLVAQLNKGMQAPGTEVQRVEVQQGIDRLKEIQKQIQELFIVISLSDVPAYLPFGVVKLQPGADAKKVFGFYQHANWDTPADQQAFDNGALLKDDVLVIGNERAIYRFKNGAQPATVPNLEQAFQLAGETQLQLLFVPTDGARQQLSRLMPQFHKDFGIDGPTLLSSVSYLSIGVKTPPGFELKVEAQGKDAASAQQVHGAITKMFDMFRQAQSAGPGTELVLNAFMPKLNNDRLAISLKEGDPVYRHLESQLTEQLSQAQSAAGKLQSLANLKEIGRAMQIYHDSKGSFPAADQGGLSWRVHLLPMLGHEELYRQFKLDEPWDSAHNKPLVEKMPDIYRHPTAKPAQPGMTVYVAPTGPGTLFPPDRRTRFADVADGTTQSAMLLEVNSDKAVIWTKPDDWPFDDMNPVVGLGGLWGDNTVYVTFVDGSVHMLDSQGDAECFRRLMKINDRQLAEIHRIEATGKQGGPDLSALASLIPTPRPQLPNSTGYPLPGSGYPPPGSGYPPPGSGYPNPDSERPPPGPMPNTSLPPGESPMPGTERGYPPMPGTIPGTDPNAPGEPTYSALARQAWAMGKDAEGFQYLYAEALAGDDDDNLKSSLRWSPSLRRPTAAIRWGLGILYLAKPATYTGDPTPIGRTPPPGAAAPNGNGGGGSGGGGGASAPQPGALPTVILDYATGELGVKVLEGLRSRIDQGQFGEMLKVAAMAPVAGSANPAGYPGGSGYPGGPPMGEGYRGPGAGDTAQKPTFEPQGIVPGVMLVGVDKVGDAGKKSLLAKAKEEQLDGLILFEVTVTPTRTVVNNSTKLILIDVASGEALVSPPAIKNTVVEAARREGRGDPVESLMKRLFDAIDEHFALTDLPDVLNQTNVTARVQKITDGPQRNKLATLLEIAFWQERNLLSPDDAQVAHEKLLGPAGAKFSAGGKDAKAALEKLLPSRPKPPVGSGQ